MIKVIIVESSPAARGHLKETLESDPGILVMAQATTGDEAVRLVKKLNPDIVTMARRLKNENGLDIAAALMAGTPKPILIMADDASPDPALACNAVDCGALDVFPALPAKTSPEFESRRKGLLRLIRTLSTVPVATRWSTAHPAHHRMNPPPPAPLSCGIPLGEASRRILLIGASTGGPPLVANLLGALPKPLPIPIVLVQHISTNLGGSFATWLTQVSGFRSVIVKDRTLLDVNTVYIAPDSRNIAFTSSQHLSPVPVRPSDRISPSIDNLFESGAVCFGHTAMALLLTGMGKDGALGLKQLKDAGAYTIAQSPETCAVASMPSTAISLQAACDILPPEKIPTALIRELDKNRGERRRNTQFCSNPGVFRTSSGKRRI